jgi:hypothetical protein
MADGSVPEPTTHAVVRVPADATARITELDLRITK